MTSPTRVRLTESAATRFPDLAGATGTQVMAENVGGESVWLLVVWDGQDAPHTWLPPGDVEPEFPALDPSDPNAPAP